MPDQSSEERLLSVYEKLYYFELDRKENLFTRFPILLALYSILLGTLASYLSNLPEGKLYLLIIFYGAAIGHAVCTGWSTYYTYRFLYSDDYDYLLPDASQEDREDLEGDPGGSDDPREAETDIVRMLIDKYSYSILQNFNLNKDRNADFFKATNLIIVALVFVFIGAFPYFTLREGAKSKSQRVTIDSVVKVKVMADTTIPQKTHPASKPVDSVQSSTDARPDATGLGVYRLRDRHTSAESKKHGEWIRRK